MIDMITAALNVAMMTGIVMFVVLGLMIRQ
jgi:hypothetical protein